MPQRDLDLIGQESPKLLIEIRTLIEGLAGKLPLPST
jgi:hypothetical protein